MHRPGLINVDPMTPLTEQLTRAWTVTAASKDSAERLRVWKTRHVEFARVTSVDHLARLIHYGNRDRANRFVTILLAEAETGDTLAHDTLSNALHYLAIGVWHQQRSTLVRRDDDSFADVVADFYEILADLAHSGASDYPIRQLWNRLECRARRRRSRGERTGIPLTTYHETVEEHLAAPIPELDAANELLLVLAAAVNRGTITAADAAVVADKGVLDRPIAAQALIRGCSAEYVQKRHRRLLDRLAAVSDQLSDSFLTIADMVDVA